VPGFVDMGGATSLLVEPAAEAAFADRVVAAFAGVDPRICCLQAGSSLFASVFGFGDAVIAIPLLAVLFHVEAVRAAPLVIFVTFFLSVANTAIDVSSGIQAAAGRWRTSAAMVGGAVVGVPLGVETLVRVEPYLIRGGVGAFLVCYGLWDALREEEEGDAVEAVDEASAAALAIALPTGVAAGFLGGAIAEPGPLAVVFGKSRRWAPPTMRAMLLRFFLPVQVLALAKFRDAGLLTPEILAQGLAALPGVALAVVAGTRINRSVDAEQFAKVVGAVVGALGVLCLGTAVADFRAVGAASSSSIILSSLEW